MRKKDEKLIKPGDDNINIGLEPELDIGDLDDRYSIAVVENPLYAENEGAAVSFHKGDGEDDEEEVKVRVNYNYIIELVDSISIRFHTSQILKWKCLKNNTLSQSRFYD